MLMPATAAVPVATAATPAATSDAALPAAAPSLLPMPPATSSTFADAWSSTPILTKRSRRSIYTTFNPNLSITSAAISSPLRVSAGSAAPRTSSR